MAIFELIGAWFAFGPASWWASCYRINEKSRRAFDDWQANQSTDVHGSVWFRVTPSGEWYCKSSDNRNKTDWFETPWGKGYDRLKQKILKLQKRCRRYRTGGRLGGRMSRQITQQEAHLLMDSDTMRAHLENICMWLIWSAIRPALALQMQCNSGAGRNNLSKTVLVAFWSRKRKFCKYYFIF